MNATDINISKDRVAVSLESGKVAQFVVWDLEEKQHEDLRTQLTTAFGICKSFDDIVKHLKINGFDADLEDIYDE